LGAGEAGEAARSLPPADVDGDGRPDVVCAFMWGSAADIGARAHEACHTVQQRAPETPHGGLAARACHGSGEVIAVSDEGMHRGSAACWEQAKALAGTAGFDAAAQVCLAAGDLDGDGALDRAASLCAAPSAAGIAIDEPGVHVCEDATAEAKARHHIAMNAIRNMKA
jgi:hypothetical protein